MIESLATHNGIFTVTSITTGEHRTFRIKTQAEDAKFAPGSRVVSLLTGPDNSNDYKSFGFVNPGYQDNIKIAVWKKYRGSGWDKRSTFEKYAATLENLSSLEGQGKIEILVEGLCRICNRKLTEPESLKTGIGPVCAGRVDNTKPYDRFLTEGGDGHSDLGIDSGEVTPTPPINPEEEER